MNRSIDRLMMLVVQRVIGTGWFLLFWLLAVVGWFVTGGLGLDPEPFFLLNIFMSVWATLTLPVLTMASRWMTEQQEKQMAYQSELAEAVRDMLTVMRDQISDIDADVDAIREARQIVDGE